ncbi:DUF6445 family protein [Sphingomonas sp.]|uniref:DUF6445 family protein n=1 Tax=Sphingomonas sp. TaxID=28214 RepID=UPI003D6C9FE2
MIVHPAIDMGREHVPLVIVDDAHDAAGQLCEAASGVTFERSETDQYPGIRAVVPESYASWLETLAETAGLGERACVLRTSYAIATDDPANLSPIQRIPHFDTTDPAVIAAVHYLCAPPHGGTGFYRHRRSAFERIDASRHPAWRQGLVRDAQEFGLPDRPCEAGHNALFELIGFAELRFNRVIFYPANCLHSGIIGDEKLSPSPDKGRLTITSLLKVPSAYRA